MIKQKPGVSQLLKHGMKDLEEIIGLLKHLGIKLQVCKILFKLTDLQATGPVVCQETT